MPGARSEADWDGIKLESYRVGAEHDLRHKFAGVQYVNADECALARLLTSMDIPFTADVKLIMKRPGGGTRQYVPDFIFDKREYVWTETGLIVHGLEAKVASKGRFSPRSIENRDLLYAQRGIMIKLISGKEIREWFNRGRLPLKLR